MMELAVVITGTVSCVQIICTWLQSDCPLSLKCFDTVGWATGRHPDYENMGVGHMTHQHSSFTGWMPFLPPSINKLGLLD